MSKGWVGGIAEWQEGETAFISVVFTWHLNEAYQRAAFWKAAGYKVKVGGPAVFVRKDYLSEVAEVGGDIADAISRQNPNATFASRGCPVGCWFCIVPAMEGKEFTLLPDFTVRPILCDNNLSALPAKYQEHIIEKYQKSGIALEDANSGFEPRTFDREVYERWNKINRGPWRFAYDDTPERKYVKPVMDMLRDVSPGRKRVYVLIGNEPFAECLKRVNEVIKWGGEPHVQPLMRLNALHKTPWVRFDWTARKLRNMARWANRHVWRKVPDFNDYKPNVKTEEIYDNQEGLFK